MVPSLGPSGSRMSPVLLGSSSSTTGETTESPLTVRFSGQGSAWQISTATVSRTFISSMDGTFMGAVLQCAMRCITTTGTELLPMSRKKPTSQGPAMVLVASGDTMTTTAGRTYLSQSMAASCFTTITETELLPMSPRRQE